MSASPEKATITRSIAAGRDELRKVAEAAEHRQIGDVRAPLARVVVDESDEIDPVLRVLLDLARDQLADVAGADDHRFCEYARSLRTIARAIAAPGEHEQRARTSRS